MKDLPAGACVESLEDRRLMAVTYDPLTRIVSVSATDQSQKNDVTVYLAQTTPTPAIGIITSQGDSFLIAQEDVSAIQIQGTIYNEQVTVDCSEGQNLFGATPVSDSIHFDGRDGDDRLLYIGSKSPDRVYANSSPASGLISINPSQDPRSVTTANVETLDIGGKAYNEFGRPTVGTNHYLKVTGGTVGLVGGSGTGIRPIEFEVLEIVAGAKAVVRSVPQHADRWV